MKIAVLTPLPPVKSGIAHYSAMLLPELARRHEVVAVVDQETVELDGCLWITFETFEERAASYDAVISQMGNNVHHEFVWKWARRNPGIVVLHEIVLHHLLVESTLARGDGEGLVSALREEHGEAGAQVAGARIAGLHGEITNFLFPASSRLAEGARHVIVHNEWAAAGLRREGVTTPITVVHHPFEEPPAFSSDEIDRVRRNAGWDDATRIIGAFGFVTRAKRPEVVMEAFAAAVRTDPALRLVFVGESAPGTDLFEIATGLGVPPTAWATTGYVTDREFDLWLNVVDRVVSLRYPTAGESSGPVVRAFAVGRPVAVSDYAQFAEFPESLVWRVPFEREVESVTAFMVDASLDGEAIGRAQRAWLASTSTASATVDGYERALRDTRPREPSIPIAEGLPLHPHLDVSVESIRDDGHFVHVTIRLTNPGEARLISVSWGQPGYLLRSTMVYRNGSRVDSTNSLSRDLRKGDSTLMTITGGSGDIDRIELRHALSGVPDLDREPFEVLELER